MLSLPFPQARHVNLQLVTMRLASFSHDRDALVRQSLQLRRYHCILTRCSSCSVLTFCPLPVRQARAPALPATRVSCATCAVTSSRPVSAASYAAPVSRRTARDVTPSTGAAFANLAGGVSPQSCDTHISPTWQLVILHTVTSSFASQDCRVIRSYILSDKCLYLSI